MASMVAAGGMDLNATIGSLFVGYTVSLWLYGITMSQIGLFLHRSSGNKSVFLRVIAWTLFVLENAQTIVISHGVWLYTISYHGRPHKLDRPTRSFGVLVYCTSINNGLVRCVYAYRIYKLTGGKFILPGLVVILSVMVAVMACIYATEGLRMLPWDASHKLSWLLYTGYACELAANCLITACMVFTFTRRSVGWRRSDNLAQTLMIYFLNSGLLVMICVICSIVTFVVIPSSFAFLAFYLALGKLYANSLLGSLNARDIIFPRVNLELTAPAAPLLTSVVVLDTDDMLESTTEGDGEAGQSFDSTSETRLESGLDRPQSNVSRGTEMVEVPPATASISRL
ncbi:hypothetical protein BV20DRAFT_1116875 [Pilatotrama ljubarskyi]|nr:hypothetical protein BV20DRAFT_1116875 [Pilatotrama ljubarskyi]